MTTIFVHHGPPLENAAKIPTTCTGPARNPARSVKYRRKGILSEMSLQLAKIIGLKIG
jgi:hypothetical protein